MTARTSTQDTNVRWTDWAETLSGVGLTAAFGTAFLIVLAQVYSVIAA